MNIGRGSTEWLRDGLAANPGTRPWFVTCDGGHVGVAWVPADADTAPDVVITSDALGEDPAALAQALLRTLPMPPITVGANPGTGMVALPSWFWVDGYDGSPIVGAEGLGGVTVEVEVTASVYRWSFGDGTTLETTSLGAPYPAESDVQHVYESSSLAVGGAFDVELQITFAARYRVDGGEWQPLAPLVTSFTRSYPVQQLQSVLTSNR